MAPALMRSDAQDSTDQGPPVEPEQDRPVERQHDAEVGVEDGGETEAAAGAPAAGGRTRKPNVAAALSVVPGLGQLYNGQGGKAGFFFLAVLLTIGPSCLLIAAGRNIAIDVVANQGAATYLLFVFVSLIAFLGLFCLGLGFWASAVIDARRSADQLNRGLPGVVRWWFFKF